MTNNNQCTQGQGVDVNRNRKIQKKKRHNDTHRPLYASIIRLSVELTLEVDQIVVVGC
jgi:hypothetical protein